MNAEGTHTNEDVERIYAEQDGKCAYCGNELNGVYDVEHVQPLVRGGSNYPENLVCSCENCNSSKGWKTLEEWKGVTTLEEWKKSRGW